MPAKLKSALTLPPTDQLLSEFSALERTTMERPLSRPRLEYLRRELAAGHIVSPPRWAFAYCKHNGRRYRLNGQHTSTVFAEVPEGQRPKVVYESYECDTLEDVAMLFQNFDPRESVRSAGDVTRAVFASFPELDDYPVRLGQALVGGIQMAKLARKEWAEGTQQDTKTNARGLTSGDKAKAAAEYPGFAAWLQAGFGSNAAMRVVGRAPVVAAMLLTREADQETAERFWLAVRDGSDPRPGCASRRLREYLQEVRLTSGSSRTTRNYAGQREILAKSLQAWRAHLDGSDNVRLSYRDTSLLPKVGG